MRAKAIAHEGDWVRTRNNGLCNVWDVTPAHEGHTQWFILSGAVEGVLIAVPASAILEVRKQANES